MLYQVIRTFISGAYEHKKTDIIERIPHIKPAFAVPSGGRLNNGLLLLFCPSLTLLRFYHRFLWLSRKNNENFVKFKNIFQNRNKILYINFVLYTI